MNFIPVYFIFSHFLLYATGPNEELNQPNSRLTPNNGAVPGNCLRGFGAIAGVPESKPAIQEESLLQIDRILGAFKFGEIKDGVFLSFSPQTAEASANSKVELFELYENAPDKEAFRNIVRARASGVVSRSVIDNFFFQCEPAAMLRGMSQQELDVIASTGWVYNQVDHGTFAGAAHSGAYTQVKEYNVRVNGLDANLQGDFTTGPFRAGGRALRFTGIMTEPQRVSIVQFLKSHSKLDPTVIEQKVNALFSQSQGGKDREFLVFFSAPRFLFKPATYDYSIADQGAILPPFEYVQYLQRMGGMREITRQQYNAFLSHSASLLPEQDVREYLEQQMPHLTERVRITLASAHAQKLGRFSAKFIDVEKTIEHNKDRLNPESFSLLSEYLRKLSGFR
jgi:hypothetical protein